MQSYSSKIHDFFLSCKECRIENPRSFYGCFYIGPFNAGQSLTVANALRRTLLAELTGIAITSVQIEGAAHEYSTLPGVRESVLDILLNLKEIVLKASRPLQAPVFGFVQARGPGVVRACDLKLPPSIQCVDPDQYIATLSHDGVLSAKFSIHQGKNYVVHSSKKTQPSLNFNNASSLGQRGQAHPSTKTGRASSKNSARLAAPFSKSEFVGKNPLYLDAVFVPVNKVNYVVESYGPSENTSSNQVVILEVWTNGSLHPRQAVYESLKHLMCLFSQLEKMKVLNSVFSKARLQSNPSYQKIFNKIEFDYDYYTQKQNGAKNSKTARSLLADNMVELESQPGQKMLKHTNLQKVEIWGLSVSNRSHKLLRSAGIFTVAELIKKSPEDLKKIKGFGQKSLDEVCNALKEVGLQLRK